MHLLWNCLNTATELCRLIESIEYEDSPSTELAELKGSLHAVRSTLVPFLKESKNDPAFDVCINGLKESLEECQQLVSQVIEGKIQHLSFIDGWKILVQSCQLNTKS